MTEHDAEAPGETGTLTVMLHHTGRVVRMQAMTHMTPGVLLLLTGLSDILGGEAHGVISWLSILTGGAVVITAVRQLRTRSPRPHTAVHWPDVFAGLMLAVEALHRYDPDKGFQVAYGYSLAALLTFLLGVFHEWVARQRFVRLSPVDIRVRTRPFSSLALPWVDVTSLEMDPAGVRIGTRTGIRRISLRRFANRDEVFSAFDRFRDRIPAPAPAGESASPGAPPSTTR